jgi:microcystin-dependent protein
MKNRFAFYKGGSRVKENERFQPPPGTIVAFAGSNAPDGWLLCQGQEVSRTTYASLDNACKEFYGSYTNGSGSAGTSHFKLPDMRSRMPIGAGQGYGSRSSGTGTTVADVAFVNSSFENLTTTGWTAGTESNATSGSQITLDSITVDSSPASGRWTKNGTTGNLDFGSVLVGALTGTFYAGQTYTVTWRMRANSPTGAWLYAAFGVVSHNSQLQPPNGNYASRLEVNGFSAGNWNTYSLDWTPTSTVSSSVNFVLNDRSAFFGGSTFYWIDSLTVTLKPLTSRTLGSTGGSSGVTLTAAQSGMPSHGHGKSEATHNHGIATDSHQHGIGMRARYMTTAGGTTYYTALKWGIEGPANAYSDSSTDNIGYSIDPSSPFGVYALSSKSGTGTQAVSIASNSANASSAHNNIQPSLALNYIIKT